MVLSLKVPPKGKPQSSYPFATKRHEEPEPKD